MFITEVGYSEAGKGADGAAANVIALMKAVEERMPYVETVNIFRMFDNADTDWAAHGNVSRFGFSPIRIPIARIWIRTARGR